ncbi:MAG: hypothetical protein WKF84_09035 [Pyrinomonadaceae bacterium]
MSFDNTNKESSRSSTSPDRHAEARQGAVKRSGPKERANHERRVLMMSLGGGLPAIIVSLVFLWSGGLSAKVSWTLTIFIFCTWLAFSFALQTRVVRPLQTISNLLAAVREGDYSIRARGARGTDSLAEVMREVNALGETLRGQRLGGDGSNRASACSDG